MHDNPVQFDIDIYNVVKSFLIYRFTYRLDKQIVTVCY
jgi:hypothetical protein